jgi:hypothetical protein
MMMHAATQQRQFFSQPKRKAMQAALRLPLQAKQSADRCLESHELAQAPGARTRHLERLFRSGRQGSAARAIPNLHHVARKIASSPYRDDGSAPDPAAPFLCYLHEGAVVQRYVSSQRDTQRTAAIELPLVVSRFWAEAL